jgi:NO-binding membrane sensor protein with MHYT domain
MSSMQATYNSWLVALSVAVAVLAAFVALRLAARAAESDSVTRRYWLFSGGMAMGIGMWSMHFIGMRAFSLPIALHYDVPTTLLSLAVAIITSSAAISIATGSRRPGIAQLLLGGLGMGCGLACMHYLGLEAIDVVPLIGFRIPLVAASVAVAVVGSCGALLLALRLHDGRAAVVLGRFGGAILMGLSIGGMHYISMAAAIFRAGSYCQGGVSLNSDWLVVTTALVAVSVLAPTLVAEHHPRAVVL